MALFGLGKKKEEEVNSSGCCSGCFDGVTMEKTTEAISKGEAVKVLGSGCAKCNQLEANVKTALEQLGMDTAIEHVTDFSQIAAYGVMSTPALVVDGKVVAYGKVLKVDEAVKLLKKIR
jgi:small redox-active disulfide protein 2